MAAETFSASYKAARNTLRNQGAKPGPTLGVGRTLAGSKRHRRMPKDAITGITFADVRRLARRGGIKRISHTVYDETRAVLKDRLKLILGHVVKVVESRNGKIVTTTDVVYVLKRFIKNPIYGFGGN